MNENQQRDLSQKMKEKIQEKTGLNGDNKSHLIFYPFAAGETLKKGEIPFQFVRMRSSKQYECIVSVTITNAKKIGVSL